MSPCRSLVGRQRHRRGMHCEQQLQTDSWAGYPAVTTKFQLGRWQTLRKVCSLWCREDASPRRTTSYIKFSPAQEPLPLSGPNMGCVHRMSTCTVPRALIVEMYSQIATCVRLSSTTIHHGCFSRADSFLCRVSC